MYDAIVVGLGGMGSATLYHLARSGHRVLGLEQFQIGHALGSSHGSTRIIRLAYSEGPEYVPLLQAAYRYWRELERSADLDGPLLHVTGGLDIGPAGSWTVEGSKRSCLEHGLDFEELDAAEVNRRFGGYSLPASMVAIYQPDGGYVMSEAAIHAHIEGATDAGADTDPGPGRPPGLAGGAARGVDGELVLQVRLLERVPGRGAELDVGRDAVLPGRAALPLQLLAGGAAAAAGLAGGGRGPDDVPVDAVVGGVGQAADRAGEGARLAAACSCRT